MTEQSYASAPRPRHTTSVAPIAPTAVVPVTTSGEPLLTFRQVDVELLAQEVRLLHQELRELQQALLA